MLPGAVRFFFADEIEIHPGDGSLLAKPFESEPVTDVGPIRRGRCAPPSPGVWCRIPGVAVRATNAPVSTASGRAELDSV
jgi:hypothetical protein